jgi:hypothetical protein
MNATGVGKLAGRAKLAITDIRGIVKLLDFDI